MKSLRPTFLSWIPFAVAITCVVFIVYAVVQQTYRQSANDLQIQIAEDIAGALTSGALPTLFDQKLRVDIARSLSTFVIVYDSAGNVLASSAVLHIDVPKLPEGVLRYVGMYGEDRLTWQPEPSVRIAAVVTKFNGGFVLAGRSLREVEKRVSSLGFMMLAGWLGTLIITFGALFFSTAYGARETKRRRRASGE